MVKLCFHLLIRLEINKIYIVENLYIYILLEILLYINYYTPNIRHSLHVFMTLRGYLAVPSPVFS